MREDIKILFLFAMLFCHIVDDYYLQGILAQLKQKDWWKAHAPDDLYKNDYKVALGMHGLSWSIMIHIPIVVFLLMCGQTLSVWFFLSVIVNAIFHAYIDDLKANKKSINLIIDQTVHVCCIAFIWEVFCLIW